MTNQIQPSVGIDAFSCAADVGKCADELAERLLIKNTALLAELEPTNATEALIGVQMIGAHKLALEFLYRAGLSGQPAEFVDANINRAARLMRIFEGHAEAMAKSKGKTGQQRMVVEHVNVQAGGQAIVGTVIPRGPSGGVSGDLL